jgi:hypothetical protein
MTEEKQDFDTFLAGRSENGLRQSDGTVPRQVTTADGRKRDCRNGRNFRNAFSTPRGNVLDAEGCIVGINSPEFEPSIRKNLQSRLRDLIQMCCQDFPEDLLLRAIAARDLALPWEKKKNRGSE